MYILLVAPDESRNRYRFLEVPLLRGGHRVDVVKTAPVRKYLSRTLKIARQPTKHDLVIVVGFGVKSLLAYAIARFSGIPILVRLGGDPVKDRAAVARSSIQQRQYGSWLLHKISMIIEKRLIKKFDGILVVSKPLGKKIAEWAGKSNRIIIVPQYCEVSKKSCKYDIGNPMELLSVTNLSFENKSMGIIWLIDQVIKYASTSNSEITYRVAGGGAYLSSITNHLSKLYIPDNLDIHLEGFVDDIETLYRQANIFLYHSEHDALPNVILEAKRYGLPMIVNDCEEFRSMIIDGISGMVYRNGSEFSQRLTDVISDISLRKSIGEEAKAALLADYSINAVQNILKNELKYFLTGVN